ncbi:hypothetical protein OQA88_7033 [Cercophora sp. LCS_1]
MIESLLARYPPGYVEVLGSTSIQILYLAFGLLIEAIRPRYKSSTSRKMILHSLRNHTVATAMHFAYVVFHSGASVLTRTFNRPYTPPSPFEVITHLLIGLLMRDVIFWSIHRLWHARGVYKWVHKKHHEVRHPAEHHVWTISYMTVVDFVFLYGAPVIIVAKMLEMDIVTTLIFAFVSAAGEQYLQVAPNTIRRPADVMELRSLYQCTAQADKANKALLPFAIFPSGRRRRLASPSMHLNRLASHRLVSRIAHRASIRMASTIVGTSGRVYVQGEVVRRHREDDKLSVFKAESGNESFVFKRVSRPFYDLSRRLAAEFVGSRRFRMHTDYNQEEGILFYPHFRDTLLDLIQGDPNFPLVERKRILRRVGEAIQELHGRDWIHIGNCIFRNLGIA